MSKTVKGGRRRLETQEMMAALRGNEGRNLRAGDAMLQGCRRRRKGVHAAVRYQRTFTLSAQRWES